MKKGIYGRRRPLRQETPVLDDRVPVDLGPGAHGPADRIRYSDFERGAVRDVAYWPGPPMHYDWPAEPMAPEIQRRLQGRRPQVSSARQYKRGIQTGRRRTETSDDSGQGRIIESEILGGDF